MANNSTTLTERGQVSVPASVRRGMRLKTGDTLRWEAISARECRVVVDVNPSGDPVAALGFGPKFRRDQGRKTAEWMRELRVGG